MGEWITEKAIPCFRPHVRRDDAGNPVYEVTAADIPEIATNSARVTIELHGNKPPITEGHRDFTPNAKEADQPLVLGYLENFRPGNLPDGTPCVLCDRRYMAKHAERYQRHPFPSVDYIHARKAIVGLAKLTRPPALNTGAVYYPGTTDPVYVYSMGTPTMEPNAQQPTEQPGTTPQMTPEEMQGCQKVESYLFGKHPWMKAAADKYAADLAAAPGATNTEPPKTEEKPVEKKKEDEVSTNAANRELIQKYEAAEARLKAVEADREAEKAKSLGLEVDRMLDGLEHVERYQFDRAEVRADMLQTDDAGRQKEMDRIRKYHPKLSGGEPIQIYAGNVGSTAGAGQDTMGKALAYQKTHKTDYPTALEAVKAGKS